jgi:DNA-binding XRE family transcriptional regulator
MNWGRRLKRLRSARHRALIAAIINAREAAGLAQRHLAAQLHRSDSFVSKIEAGERVEILEFAEICRAPGAKPSTICAKVLD